MYHKSLVAESFRLDDKKMKIFSNVGSWENIHINKSSTGYYVDEKGNFR